MTTNTDIEPTWANRDLPILKSALRLLDRPDTHFAAFQDISAETGLGIDKVLPGADALENAYPPYVHVGQRGN
jgi:hypothetical protein